MICVKENGGRSWLTFLREHSGDVALGYIIQIIESFI